MPNNPKMIKVFACWLFFKELGVYFYAKIEYTISIEEGEDNEPIRKTATTD